MTTSSKCGRECDFGLLTFFLATMYEGISVDLSKSKHLTIIFYKIRFNIILSYCVNFSSDSFSVKRYCFI